MKVINRSHVEAVTLTQETLMKFGEGQHEYSASLSEQVTIAPEEEVELVFSEEEVPELSAQENVGTAYEVTVEFRGTGGYYQNHILVDKVTIPPETLIVSRSAPYNNSPLIIRGECDFGDVEILSDGRLIAEHSKASLKNLIVEGKVVNKEKFTVEGNDVTISSGGRVEVCENAHDIEIRAENLTVDGGATITAEAAGYTRHSQPRYTNGVPKLGGGYDSKQHGGGGGGYGGEGGNGDEHIGDYGSPEAQGLGGKTYGYEKFPYYLGSAGGTGGSQKENGGVLGGAGGGRVRINVKNTLTVNGDIIANGEDGEFTPACLGDTCGSGGGSGGSIWITAKIFQGSGTIKANGGNGGGLWFNVSNPGGGGGGGRVYADCAQSTFPLQNMHVNGGVADTDGTAEDGDQGSRKIDTTPGGEPTECLGGCRVILADLATDSNNDGSISVIDDERVEEDEPGRCDAPGGDRAQVKIYVTPTQGTITLEASEGGEHISVWWTKSGTDEITLPATYPLDEVYPHEVWVQGNSIGSVMLDLVYKDTVGVEKRRDKVRFTVCRLVSITVVSGATQNNVTQDYPNAGDQNWACVMEEGHYTVGQVTTEPNTEAVWSAINWYPEIIADAGYPVAGYLNRRQYHRYSAVKKTVLPDLGGSRLNPLYIWVLWTKKLEIKTTGTTPPNSVQWGTSLDGTENLGAIAYTDGSGNREGWGKVAPWAQMFPSGVHNVVTAGWAFKRDEKEHTFTDAQPWEGFWFDFWHDDTSDPQMLKLTPDSDDKIYDLDAPDVRQWTGRTVTDSAEHYVNFRQWIEWNDEKCSPYVYWYWRGRWKKDATPDEITLKEVGTASDEGTLPALPDTAYYPAP